jgi:excisionase family DNA binding protein
LSLADRLALRPAEAAQALGIGERTLRQILPELPHVRVGGAVLLPVEALQAWLREKVETEQGRAEKVVEEILHAVESHE